MSKTRLCFAPDCRTRVPASVYFCRRHRRYRELAKLLEHAIASMVRMWPREAQPKAPSVIRAQAKRLARKKPAKRPKGR